MRGHVGHGAQRWCRVQGPRTIAVSAWGELPTRGGSLGVGVHVGKWAPKNKIFYPNPGTTVVIDHGITTRRAGAELLKRVGVVQMEAGSAVARSTSRAARPCAADAAPPRYPHVREDALHSGLLDLRERPRASARRRGGKQEGAAAKERG